MEKVEVDTLKRNYYAQEIGVYCNIYWLDQQPPITTPPPKKNNNKMIYYIKYLNDISCTPDRLRLNFIKCNNMQ